MGVRDVTSGGMFATARRTIGKASPAFGFNANEFGTPTLWLDSLALGGTGVANPSDNTAVSSWVDRVSGRAITQAGSGEQPRFYSSTKTTARGNPVVYFDGDYLRESALAAISAPITTYVVFSRDGLSLNAGGAVILDLSYPSTGARVAVAIETDARLYLTDASVFYYGPSVASTGQFAVCSVVNGASSQLGYTGSFSSGTVNGPSNTGVTLGISRSLSSTIAFRGWIACVLVYNEAHDSTKRAAVLAALDAAY